MIIDSWKIYLLRQVFIIDASVAILLFWLLPISHRILCTGCPVTCCSTIAKTIFTFSTNKTAAQRNCHVYSVTRNNNRLDEYIKKANKTASLKMAEAVKHSSKDYFFCSLLLLLDFTIISSCTEEKMNCLTTK